MYYRQANNDNEPQHIFSDMQQLVEAQFLGRAKVSVLLQTLQNTPRRKIEACHWRSIKMPMSVVSLLLQMLNFELTLLKSVLPVLSSLLDSALPVLSLVLPVLN